MFIVYILIIVFVLLFIPIPLKLNITYSQSNFELKFYNIVLYSKDNGIINKYLKKKKTKETKNTTTPKYKSSSNFNKTKKTKAKVKPDINDILHLIKILNNNKFKPKLKIDYKLQYSLNNASSTALLYGAIWNINTLIFNALSIIFKLKYFNPIVQPLFINKFSVNISFSCIISFNLAKLIYMLFKILSCKKTWEVIPL